MSRECNERMWNLAYRLAHCGEHRNYQAIEWELQAYGYPKRANYCTTHASVKAGRHMRRSTEVPDRGFLILSPQLGL